MVQGLRKAGFCSTGKRSCKRGRAIVGVVELLHHYTSICAAQTQFQQHGCADVRETGQCNNALPNCTRRLRIAACAPFPYRSISICARRLTTHRCLLVWLASPMRSFCETERRETVRARRLFEHVSLLAAEQLTH